MLSENETNPQVIATKCRIRDQAEVLFGHYGFSKTSVNDIAQACSMSTGNIYRFFRNKQAIGLAVVEHYFDEQTGKMLRVRHNETGSAEERLRETILIGVAHLVETMEANPRVFEMAEFVCTDPEGAALVESHRAFMRDIFVSLIAEGVQEGEFTSPAPHHDGWTLLLATTAFWMPQALIAWHRHDAILSDLQDVLGMLIGGLKTPR
ncbi:TetR/AcrR family transcriptional regulator [Rhodobacteraceae bacterium NNCM2]|nr:TetR/AcrR family transcriptional regulator [Coraliihabitans acroporae]